MTASPAPPETRVRPRARFSLSPSRDWPLFAVALAALLSFAMLFAPWVTGPLIDSFGGVGDVSLNAFGKDMQTTGPALIIVMALATVLLVALALVMGRWRYTTLALIPATNLLFIYIVKLGDVTDLIESTRLSTGSGLWLGFVFALATVLLLCAALVLDRRRESGAQRAAGPPAPEGAAERAAGPPVPESAGAAPPPRDVPDVPNVPPEPPPEFPPEPSLGPPPEGPPGAPPADR